MTNEEQAVIAAAVNFRRQVTSGIVLDRKSGSLNRLLAAVNAYNATQKQCPCNPYWEAGDWRFACRCPARRAERDAHAVAVLDAVIRRMEQNDEGDIELSKTGRPS